MLYFYKYFFYLSRLATYPVPLKPLIYVFTQNHKTAESEHVDYKQFLKILDSESILEKQKSNLERGCDSMRKIADFLLLTSFRSMLQLDYNMKKIYILQGSVICNNLSFPEVKLLPSNIYQPTPLFPSSTCPGVDSSDPGWAVHSTITAVFTRNDFKKRANDKSWKIRVRANQWAGSGGNVSEQ